MWKVKHQNAATKSLTSHILLNYWSSEIMKEERLPHTVAELELLFLLQLPNNWLLIL